jgi:hypothetical protein
VLPPVLAVPRPRSWSSAPPPVADARDEELDIEEVSSASAAAAEVNVAQAPSVGPVTSEVDVPADRPRRIGRKTFATVIGIAAALTVAAVAWREFASPSEPSAAAVVARVPEPARAPAPEPEKREPAPPPAMPVPNEVVATPTVVAAVETPPEKPSSAVTVTIETIPEGAVVFRARQRLGSGVVAVNIERNAKQRFTALLDGYTPANFTLDGSRDSVTIRLKRVPRPQATPPPESAPAGDVPNVAANAVAAPASTDAPASVALAPATVAAPTVARVPEGTPPPSPTPDVPSPE